MADQRSSTTKLLPVVLILTTFFPSGIAQQVTSPPATRSVLVNVLDRHGNALRDLTKESFLVRLDGKPATLLDARYSLAPRRIVVLLDMSGSMTEESSEKRRMAREAMDDLLAQTPADVPIALLTFSGKVRDVFDFHQGRTAIAKWLKEGPPEQPHPKHPARTALFDAVLEALKLLQPVQPGDAVYAITDGGDNASAASTAHTKAALLQSGVRLFAFLFAEPMRLPNEQANLGDFIEMIDDSGGFAFGVSSHPRFETLTEFDYVDDKGNRERIKAYTQQLNVQVHGFWTLDVVAPFSKKQSKLTIQVVDHDGKARRELTVTYPRELPPTN